MLQKISGGIEISVMKYCNCSIGSGHIQRWLAGSIISFACIFKASLLSGKIE